MATTLEVLRKARELVASGWTQGQLARDASGQFVDPCGTKACRWCALGSVYAAVGSVLKPAYDDAVGALRRATGRVYLSEWNDAFDRTQAEVVAAFDKAMAAELAASQVSP